MLFQELVQNAEDAGASHVKFLYDKNSYGTEKLHSEGLARFQVCFAVHDTSSSDFALTITSNRPHSLRCLVAPSQIT